MSIIEPDWTMTVKEIGPDLYKYFLGSFSSQLAADLVQETLIRLVQKYRNQEFDLTKGPLKAYAFGIARFVRLENYKKKADFELVDDDSKLDVQSYDPTQQTDPVAHLRWAISQLKPIEQDLILEMIDGESTFEKISIDFNIPVGTVKSHIHRAKEKLRQIMEVNHEQRQ